MSVVADIMEWDVVTIPPNASVSDLVNVLEESGVSGVPVVDDREVLVGVVSQRDIVRLARELERVPEAMRWTFGPSGRASEANSLQGLADAEFFAYYVKPTGEFVDVRDQLQELPADVFDGYRVKDIMTSTPFTVDRGTAIADLARLLLDRKIHRALVVDGAKLVGIVTTSDILKKVAEG